MGDTALVQRWARVTARWAHAMASPRRRWIARFCVVFGLCAIWALATPLFAGPDEPAHVIRAAGLSRGDFVAHDLVGSNQQMVDVAERFSHAQAAADCLKNHPERNGTCVSFVGSDEVVAVATTAGRYPPLAYLLPAVALRLSTRPIGVYLARLATALMASACIATAFGDMDRLGSRLGRVGVAVATTPTVFFLSGVVNPSALEIVAALATWTSGLVLLHEAAHAESTGRSAGRFVLAASVLLLSRQLAPLWLAVAAVVIVVGYCGRPAARSLWGSRRVRTGAGAVAVAGAFQLWWIFTVWKPKGDRTVRLDDAQGVITRLSIGRLTGEFRQMIGVFGWLDTPSPELTYLLWTTAVGALVLLGFACSSRRQRWALGLLMLAVVALPVLIEVRQAPEYGLSWQGRYTLPIAVGVPLLAGVAAEGWWRDRGISTVSLARMVVGCVGVAHVAAFWQHLRRYTVGANGRLLFFRSPLWHAPVASWLLLGGYIVGIAAYLMVTTGVPFDLTEVDERTRCSELTSTSMTER